MALTAEEQNAAALGFTMPEGDHFISRGDDAIRNNARAAIRYARQAGIVENVPSEIDSFNQLVTPGDYQIFGRDDAERIALDSYPVEFREGKIKRSAAVISVRKPRATNFVWQELKVWVQGINRIWVRQTHNYNDSSLVFNEWSEVKTTSPGSSDTRAAAVNLTTPVANYYEDALAMNHRVPFKMPVSARRFRLHVAARNDASEVEINDPELRLNQMPVIGKHKLENGAMTGQFAEEPFNAATLGTIRLPDSNEYVGEWINTPLEANTEYLFSFSYYNPNRVQIPSGMSGSFIQSATGYTNRLDTPGIRYYFKTPFSIWLEVEVEKDTPVIAFIGDSLMVGRDSDAPLYYSPAWLRARREGFLPRMHAIAGGRMKQFIDNSEAPRWTRYAALGKADAVVIEIGSNDFFDQINKETTAEIVAEMKGRLEALVNLARRHISETVYYCTVLPRNNRAYGEKVDNALLEYNEWLQTLPFGAVGCYDWAGAIGTGDRRALETRYVAEDLVHLKTAGYVAVSGAPLANRPASGAGGAATVVATDPRVSALLVRLQALEAKAAAPAPAPEAPPVQDTGWLNITPAISSSTQLATSKNVGTWRLRRRGDVVLLEVSGLATDRAGFSHSAPEFSGFNGLWVEERTKPGDVHITGAISKNRLWINSLINNNSSAMNFRLWWLTADPWPETLPA